jgi:hypothetical protein
MMYDHEKSDPAIVAVRPTNKAGQPAAVVSVGNGRRYRGKLAIRSNVAPQTVFGRSVRTVTMMQSCASAKTRHNCLQPGLTIS